MKFINLYINYCTLNTPRDLKESSNILSNRIIPNATLDIYIKCTVGVVYP